MARFLETRSYSVLENSVFPEPDIIEEPDSFSLLIGDVRTDPIYVESGWKLAGFTNRGDIGEDVEIKPGDDISLNENGIYITPQYDQSGDDLPLIDIELADVVDWDCVNSRPNFVMQREPMDVYNAEFGNITNANKNRYKKINDIVGRSYKLDENDPVDYVKMTPKELDRAYFVYPGLTKEEQIGTSHIHYEDASLQEEAI